MTALKACAAPATEGLDCYVVGGAVRDTLLGLSPGDRDWVVVGSTPEEMVQRGFMPVGGDFPVFLHPISKEEYALARTERKTARGYQGFSFYTGPEVTLEDDLNRRDFTVNAMAQTADGRLIDPLQGQCDLAARVFRHVGEAFAEDPVRILRLSRFAARFEDFSVAPQTYALCRAMVQSGEVDALVAERVWKEISRGLMSTRPSRMFDVLRECGALVRVAPELNDDDELGARIDRGAQAGLPLPSRYALLCLESEQRDGLSRRWRVPVACADYARLLPMFVESFEASTAPAAVDVLERGDAIRKPERFEALMTAAKLARFTHLSSDVLRRWSSRVQAVGTVDGGAIARACAGDPSKIKPALRAARVSAVEQADQLDSA